MAEEKEQFEERTVTLKKTKRRLTAEEKEAHEAKNGQPNQTDTGGENCGQWYLVWYESYHAWFTCRICYTGAPTWWPYEECIGLPQ